MIYKRFILTFFIYFPIIIFSQNKITGIVIDSTTNRPVSFVAVYIQRSKTGTTTDNSGRFKLRMNSENDTVVFSSVGYRTKLIQAGEFENKKIHKVFINQVSIRLNECVIQPKHEKYKKRNNPAVIFIRKVIADKDRYNPLNKPYYSYKNFKRTTIALNNFQEKEKGLFCNFKNYKEYLDTSNISGKPILPLSSKEVIANYHYRKSPKTESEIIIAKRDAGIDQMFSEDGVDEFLNEVFKNINIYDNTISLFLKRFVSPLSSGAPDFYKFYLLDTLKVDNTRCVDLGFVPFNSESTGFTGHLYIALDSTYFIKKISLKLPRKININFVQNMHIVQVFDRYNDGTRLLKKDEVSVEFSLFDRTNEFYAQRLSLNSGHTFAPFTSDSIISTPKSACGENLPETIRDSIWQANRPDSIKNNSLSVDKMLTQWRKNPLYYYSEKIFSALATGYVPTETKKNPFSFGPLYSSVSYNTLEGWRLRLGGFTTAQLNNHLFANGYIAYGLGDKIPKYNVQLEYSFNKKTNQSNEFPIHSVRLFYKYDLNRLGQQYLYSTPDNFFLSLKRLPDTKITYQREIELKYTREFFSHLAYDIGFNYSTNYASNYVPFIDTSNGQNISSYHLGAFTFHLRFAPGEKFYASLSKRRSITRDAPVISFSHTIAFKGFLNSSYSYNRTEVAFQKRFWFSAYGNSNVILKAGKVWNKTPFTLLIIPNANTSYTIQYESYSQLNPLEFVNDQYVSWDINYNANGWILNQIPLLKKLKLREIFSFRGFWGSLNNQNIPSSTNHLFQFPVSVYTMKNTPYMEAGIGVDNILKCLRIDYVWRLSYLNHPNIDKSGLRVSFDFTF